MARKCAHCGKELGFRDGTTVGGGGVTVVLCSNCDTSAKSLIDELLRTKRKVDRDALSEEFLANSNDPSNIRKYINGTVNMRLRENEPHVSLKIIAGKENLGVKSPYGLVELRQNIEGYVYFNDEVDRVFSLEEYTWDGPTYKTVTKGQEVGKTKTLGREKTKRKGGLGGAAIGTLLMPGVGTAIGYAMTSKKVANKGEIAKQNINTNIEEGQEEVDSPASLKIKEIETGKIFSFGFNCNSKIDIDLGNFEWPSNLDTGEADMNVAANSMSELDKVSVLKEYKELMDAGIISPEEFEAKKKEILN